MSESVWKVVREEGSALSDEVVEFIERIANSPELEHRCEEAFREEYMRQVGYGLPPSEGLPDIRGAFAVYPDKYLQSLDPDLT